MFDYRVSNPQNAFAILIMWFPFIQFIFLLVSTSNRTLIHFYAKMKIYVGLNAIVYKRI